MGTPRTRSGRKVKAPERWEPKEDVIDDFAADEYDSDEDSNISDISRSSSDDEGETDEDFVVGDSDSDSAEDYDAEISDEDWVK